MARLTNNAARRLTLKRRRARLIKKVTKLSILCCVPACVVVYNIDKTGEPVAWPSVQEAKNIWGKIMDMPESTQKRRMLDSKTLLQQQIAKLQKQVGKLKVENYNREITNIIFELSIGRRKNLDDLYPQVVNDVKLEVAKLGRLLETALSSSVRNVILLLCL
ncbi:hypothetical protein E2562_034535 [Oryza meyeriana var. granulata]|uniref:MADS-box domain-containing protein n=1 Tax=Oryza meyeriana var. granulata TaxID=110450 RepID=A0A6G1C992_9ORYZ|nr:hypothetical protein E2562_034535 [Oryza meyeriana var. granulata]